MRKIPREVYRSCVRDDPVETTRRRLSAATKSEAEFYLLGALHDATFSSRHKTIRFSQSSQGWLRQLHYCLHQLGAKSWIYREGSNRYVWILETSLKLDRDKKPVEEKDKISYIRGYFDAEGGMPKDNCNFLYFQFCQKDRADIEEVKRYLEEINISCGKIHNPSKNVDPNYWRFFISRISHMRFMELIGSWHPRKAKQIELRMKI